MGGIILRGKRWLDRWIAPQLGAGSRRTAGF